MFYSRILANISTILSLSTSLVNPTPALAETVQNALSLDGATATSTVAVTAAPIKTPDRTVQAVVTAYTSTPGQTDDSPFIAATGKRVHDGMIAVNGLPFGTVIKIPALFGDKEFVVEDRMNKRYSCQDSHCNMDIWMDTTVHEARVFGLHRVEAEIYLPDTQVAVK